MTSMPMLSAMPGNMPMMPMMTPMPMGMGMGAGTPMGASMMMPNMGMAPMMMPMPIMCQCTLEMTKDGMLCKLAPMGAAAMDMMAERCNAMNAMMAMGMPMAMACGGMPMMICLPGK